MSYMADRDHIAITSGDASTTRRKVSVPRCPVTPADHFTDGESSDTYRRITPDSGNTVQQVSAGLPRYSVRQFQFRVRPPLVVCAHIHSDGELALPLGRPIDGGADSGRVVAAERVVADQCTSPP